MIVPAGSVLRGFVTLSSVTNAHARGERKSAQPTQYTRYTRNTPETDTLNGPSLATGKFEMAKKRSAHARVYVTENTRRFGGLRSCKRTLHEFTPDTMGYKRRWRWVA